MTALAVVYLGADEARSLTDQIKAHVAELLPLIKEAFERRADVALGYANWLDYCDTELRGLRLPVDRRSAVAELREVGMSTRAIAAALDIPKSTVADEVARLPESGQSTAKVVSLDGRERPATQPKTAAGPEGIPADGAGPANPAAPTAGAGVDAPPAPAGIPSSPVQEFIDADPEVQAVRYRKRFCDRLAAVGPIVETDPEHIGPLLEPVELELLERYAASLAEFVEKVHAARRGLRVIKGGQ